MQNLQVRQVLTEAYIILTIYVELYLITCNQIKSSSHEILDEENFRVIAIFLFSRFLPHIQLSQKSLKNKFSCIVQCTPPRYNVHK